MKIGFKMLMENIKQWKLVNVFAMISVLIQTTKT